MARRSKDKAKDKAVEWVRRWEQLASPVTKRALQERGIMPRHHGHPDGEAPVVPERKWRFDWAIPELKIAVEIDGGNRMARWDAKQRRCVAVGRHTLSRDYEKRNAAVMAGWTLLAFTTEMLRKDPVDCVRMVETLVRSVLGLKAEREHDESEVA